MVRKSQGLKRSCSLKPVGSFTSRELMKKSPRGKILVSGSPKLDLYNLEGLKICDLQVTSDQFGFLVLSGVIEKSRSPFWPLTTIVMFRSSRPRTVDIKQGYLIC